jgi:hypothetical protein
MSKILTQQYTGIKYLKNTIYPNIPLNESDIYIITNEGDRLDTIAYTYYKDTSLWKLISAINGNINNGSMFPIPGTQLRIPLDLNNVFNILEKTNI